MHENGLQREVDRGLVGEAQEGRAMRRELPVRGIVLSVRCEEQS